MKKNFFISFALFPAVLLGSSFSVLLHTNEGKAEDSKTIFNYSTSANTKVLSGSKALEKILDSQGKSSVIEGAEAEYLDAKYALEYDALTDSKYNVGYLDNFYWVEAFEDENYSPKELRVGENTYKFSRLNNQLIAYAPEIEDAKIIYEQKVNVSAIDANKLLTEPYKLGKEEAENRQALLEYENKHAQYLEYLEKKAEYEQYLNDLAHYELKVNEYEKYLKESAKYEQDRQNYLDYCEEYDAYLEQLAKHTTYVDAKAVYDANYKIYEEALKKYNDNIAVVDSQLEVMDILFKDFGDLELSISYFINSDSVETVVNRRDEIVLADVAGAAIDLAKEKTPIVKNYINAYKDILDGTREERYKWYMNYFYNFQSAITSLTKCLEYFYTKGMVRSAAEENQRAKKYELFVAELMYFCDLINKQDIGPYIGSYKLDATRKIGGVAKTYPEILGSSLLDQSKIDANPLLALPVAPVAPEAPAYEEGIEVRPVAPTKVEEPVAPTEVAKPNESDKPTQVAKPEKYVDPVRPDVTERDEYFALANAYNLGALTYRNKMINSIAISIEEEVEVDVSLIDNAKIIALFDTRNGVNPGEAKFREFIYFSDPASVLDNMKTNLTHPYGVITNYEGDIASIFGSEPSDLNNQHIADILEGQEIALKDYSIVWSNVLNNEEHKDFVSLENQVVTSEKELVVPTFTPAQPDKYINGVRVSTYKFIGYDFTSEVDETTNSLSGLNTPDAIAEYQQSLTTAKINVVFEEVPTFDVAFEGHEKYSVEAGTMIEAPEISPVKSSTVNKIYEFAGWAIKGSSELVSFPYEVSNKSVSFEPVFVEKTIYSVEFNVNGALVSSEKVIEGNLPSAPQNVARFIDGNKFYSFTGWDKEVVAAGGEEANISYVAQFEGKEIVEGATVTQKRNIVSVDASNLNSAKFGDLFSLINEGVIGGVERLDIKLKEAEFSFNEKQILYFITSNVNEISFVKTTSAEGYEEFEIVVKNADNVPLENPSFTFDVIISNIRDVDHARAYILGAKSSSSYVNASSICFGMKLGKKVTVKYFYRVSFDEYLTTCSFELNDKVINPGYFEEFEMGETIVVTATANTGITLDEIYCVNNSGEKVELVSGSMIEVNSDLTFFCDIERNIYNVNLMVDGVTFGRLQGTYGVLVTLPTNIVKPSDDVYRYVFTGWDKEVSVFDDDYTLNAVFEQIKIKDEKEEEEEPKEGLTLGQKIGISVLSVTVAIVAAGIVIVIVKTKKKPLKK